MQRLHLILISVLMAVLLLGIGKSTYAAPLAALSLQEGRTYDQAHDQGYIDWNGSVSYVYITHRDGSSLPPEEGGAFCGSGCSEWVTRLGNGASASGSFDRDVSYFETMVEFTSQGGVGRATLQACSASMSWNLYNPTSTPGFVSMILVVPAGCRTWSLSASSGFVDFRSVDVEYSGPPNTATPTFTPTTTRTPTATFTPSLTPTLTFTPTMTFTNTPSPTSTPLPPQITGVVVCDLWGDAGWCRGDETLELTTSDPQGFDVTITGDLNGEPFTCGIACNLPLPEGAGSANYLAASASGRTAGGTSTWKRDGTAPDILIDLPLPDGSNDWYVSQVDLSATGEDSMSGIQSLEGSIDEGSNWIPLPIHFGDGVHHVLILARDMAGNEAIKEETIRVDIFPPIAQITSYSDGQIMRGEVQLGGTLMDDTSGPEGGDVSVDGGNTWESVSIGSGGVWSFLWDSGAVPNGDYIVQMRGADRAGNVGDVVTVSLIVDNAPPAVSITESWWIWETGDLKVYPNRFPIERIDVTIRDPQDRWPAVTLEFKPGKISHVVSWDRRFGDGTLAPSGEYDVVAVACDGNGLCGHDAGKIIIPDVATSTLTPTLLPTITATRTPVIIATPTYVLVTQTPLPTASQPAKTPTVLNPPLPLWQIVGLLGLFFALASASVIDPRPRSLKNLGGTFMDILVHRDDFENEQKQISEKDI